MRPRLPTHCRWLGCLLLAVASLLAQEPVALVPTLHIHGDSEGLHNLTVYAIHKDGEGRLWVGTQNGLAVHSGRRFQKVALPPPYNASVVRSLLSTRDGSLWVATDNLGVFQKNGESWIHHGAEKGLEVPRVNTLLARETKAGSMLYAGTTAGIYRLEGERWQRVIPEGGVSPTSWIWKLRTDPQGALGIAAQGWVGVERLGRWELHRPEDGLPGNEANDLIWEDGPSGPTLVVSLWNRGVFRREANRWLPLPGGPKTGNPTGLLRTRQPDGAEVLWISTFNDGLYWRSSGQWRHLDAASGLPTNGIYAMAPSDRPALWLGTRGEGLVAVDLGGWASVLGVRGEITAVFPSRNPQGLPVLWVGTPRGPLRSEGGRWHAEHPIPSYIHVNTFAETGSGADRTLWVAAIQGLFRRQGTRWEQLDPERTTGDVQVFSLLRGGTPEDEVLWAGTQEGLAEFRRGTWKRHRPAVRGSAPIALALAETRSATGETVVWIGTRGQGLWRLRAGTWEREDKGLEMVPGLFVTSLVETRSEDGSRWLWAGTVGSGLLRRALDDPNGGWIRLPPDHFPGFSATQVMALCTDASGHLYLSTEDGIGQCRVLEQGQLMLTRHFTQGDGLPGASALAGTLVSDGGQQLWFGSSRGLAHFVLGAEPRAPLLPAILLDQEDARGGLHPVGHELRIDHHTNRLRLHMSLPLFHRLEDSRYRSQLLGFESEPTPWSEHNQRDFLALPSGRSVLRVWAKDYLGRETTPRDLVLWVEAPPWRRPWALGLYVVLVGLLGWGIITVRVKLLSHRNRILTAQVRRATEALETANSDLERRVQARTQDLAQALERAEAADHAKSAFLNRMSHELRTPLNHMLLYAQLLEEDWREVLQKDPPQEFQAIQQSGRALESLISDVLDFSTLEMGQLRLTRTFYSPASLAERVAETARMEAQQKGLAFHREVEADLPDQAFGDPQRLGQVLGDLLSNAVKFTQEGSVSLKVLWHSQRRCIRFEVWDTGMGIPEAAVAHIFEPFEQADGNLTRTHEGSGLGLTIASRLVRLMGGTLGCHPNQPRGTCFWVEVPQGETA